MVFDAAPGAADGATIMIDATSSDRVFVRGVGSPPPIYSSDGTEAGSVLVSASANVSELAFSFQNRACMNVIIVNSGTSEYFCSDGSAGNFTRFTDFQGMGLTPVSDPFVLNGAVLLSAYVTGAGFTGGGIYAFDGSGAPPVKISNPHIQASAYLSGGTRLAFSTDTPGGDIVMTDGTAAGTSSLLDGTSAPRNQIEYSSIGGLDDSVLFIVNDPVSGPVTWRGDGTPAGTRFLLDSDPGSPTEGAPTRFVRNGTRAYFSAPRIEVGNELWYFSTNPGTAVDIAVAANDTDFDSSLPAPGIEILTQPAHGTATLGSSSISYSPDAGFTGADRFTYRVLDAQGNPSNAATVSVMTKVAASTANPGTAPVTPQPPPDPPPSGGSGGGGGFGWEVLLLGLLLAPRLARRLLACYQVACPPPTTSACPPGPTPIPNSWH
jgi:ELWxxDGT repeat protein